MSSHSPTPSSACPTQRSLVVINPLGLSVVGPLLLGLLLLIEAVLQAVVGYWPRATALGGLLGLGLVGWAVRGAMRSNRPMLLTSSRDAWHLEPLGRSIAKGIPPETIPLTSVQAYKYWSRLLKYSYILQYHLRLELADGRVLHLADRPGTRLDDPTGTVRLDMLIERLDRRAKSKTGPLRRPLFFQTRTARRLLWVSGALLAGGLGLLAVGQPVGILLLFPPVLYGAFYYLGQGDAYEAA